MVVAESKHKIEYVVSPVLVRCRVIVLLVVSYRQYF